jgi:hypothetical protein
MNLMDFSAASCGLAAIAIVRGRDCVRLVAAPEPAALPQLDQVRLLLDGAAALLTAAKSLGTRPSKG